MLPIENANLIKYFSYLSLYNVLVVIIIKVNSFYIKIMQTIMRALSSPPFRNYRVWWSLSDSKYAGTALLVNKCFQPKSVFFNLDRKGMLVSKFFIVSWYADHLIDIFGSYNLKQLSYCHVQKSSIPELLAVLYYLVAFVNLSL